MKMDGICITRDNGNNNDDNTKAAKVLESTLKQGGDEKCMYANESLRCQDEEEEVSLSLETDVCDCR
jgi:hypothetical protein